MKSSWFGPCGGNLVNVVESYLYTLVMNGESIAMKVVVIQANDINFD